ncbi:MAG: hypothetical protein ACQEWW_07770 [Bacillota bacterium]
MTEQQAIKYKQEIERLNKELTEMKEEAGVVLVKFLHYKSLTEMEIKKLKKENGRLKLKVNKQERRKSDGTEGKR